MNAAPPGSLWGEPNGQLGKSPGLTVRYTLPSWRTG